MCSLLRGNWTWLAEWTVRGNYPEPGNLAFGWSHWERIQTALKMNSLSQNPHNILSLLVHRHFKTLVAEKLQTGHSISFWICVSIDNSLIAAHLYFHLPFSSQISHPFPLYLYLFSCTGLCTSYPAGQWHVTWHVWDTRGKDKNRKTQKGVQWKGKKETRRKFFAMPKHRRRGGC